MGLYSQCFTRADDCGGTFNGFQATITGGTAGLQIELWIRFGTADDERFGPEYGTIGGIQLRVVIGW